jgi:hypothetical protein
MSTIKEAQHTQELEIFSYRAEAGLQVLKAWLYRERDRVNQSWPNLVAEDLSRAQGEAKCITRLIKLIEIGPTIKEIPND